MMYEQVAGVLYYFPFQGGQETLPMEDSASFDPGDTTVDLTQGERATQPTQPGLPADGVPSPAAMQRLLLPCHVS